MSESQDIKPRAEDSLVAPTPQNTPLNTQVLANRPAGQGKPQVEDVAEDDEDDGEDVSGMNPASLLANVSYLALPLAPSSPSPAMCSEICAQMFWVSLFGLRE